MASTWTTNLGIEKIGIGEQSGTWGDSVNENMDLLDEAISGIATETLVAAGSSGSPNALTISSDGTSSNARHAFIELADGADLGADVYVQLAPNDAQKIAYIRNSLTTQDAVIFQGTYSAGRAVTIPNGKTMLIKFAGTGATSVVEEVLGAAQMGSLDVDNINIDGNTISTTTGNLNLTPVAGSNITLDGTITVDAGVVTGATSITSTSFTGDLTGNADTATAATNVTVSTNTGNSGDTDLYPLMVGASTATDQAPHLDSAFSYNASTDTLTASAFAGTISTASQPNITSLGTLTLLNVDNLNLNGNTLSATTGAINITPAAGSAIVLDGTINVDAGVVTGATSITSTAFVGDLTGDVTGTLQTAAQPNVTSLGTLTALDVDNLNINGNTISATTGAVNITPAVGSAIVLDGTINIDAGVVTGATSITSTTFVGALTGNADTATSATTATNANNVDIDSTAAAGAYRVAFFDPTGTSYEKPYVSSSGGLTYDPSTDTLTVTNVTATISGVSDEVNVASTTGNTSDTTMYPLLVPNNATGGQEPHIDSSGLSYNASTNALTATTFIGNLTGNATSATSATSATTATQATLSNEVSDTTCYMVFAGGATGNQGLETNAGLTYNAVSNALTATTFVGALTGQATSASLIDVDTVNSTDASQYLLAVPAASTGTQSTYVDTGLYWDGTNSRLYAAKVRANYEILSYNGSSGATANANSNFIAETAGSSTFQFLTPNTNSANIFFGDPQNASAGSIVYSHSANSLTFTTNASSTVDIDSTGVINAPGYAADSGGGTIDYIGTNVSSALTAAWDVVAGTTNATERYVRYGEIVFFTSVGSWTVKGTGDFYLQLPFTPSTTGVGGQRWLFTAVLDLTTPEPVVGYCVGGTAELKFIPADAAALVPITDSDMPSTGAWYVTGFYYT